MQYSFLEYIFTLGILISAIALIIGIVKDRKNIKKSLIDSGLRKYDFLFIVGILIVFLFIELYFVQPTQLLFFDDVIYQAMALNLLHTGQAWMCNYGTATMCFQGQVFHEPIGLSFNFAIAFAIFGATRAAAWNTELALGVISVFLSFFASLLLLKNKKAAFFTELLMALSPVILVWARPTNSDLAVLAYSLVSVIFFLFFLKKKSAWSFSNMLFSFSLLFYMKVDEVFFIPIFIAFYLLLEEKSVIGAIKNTFKRVKENIWNTKLLIIVLFFIITVVPSILYSFNESLTDGYGWQGTVIQNTCMNNAPINVTSAINLQNFNANICGNILFWFNQYSANYVMQPILFTAFAILGAVLMLLIAKRRRALAAVGIWFLVFFLLYAAFYAGSVNYGVDWRFMLSLIAQACILGGFAIAEIIDVVSAAAKKFMKDTKIITAIAIVVMVVVLLLPIYELIPLLAVNPANIQQAGDARFYENFVYNNSNQIPAGCLVYTYDPTLFQLNNRSAIQMDNLYNSSQEKAYSQQYKCLVLDYGYWCHTPNNECTYANQSYNLVPIVTATYNSLDYKYGFYYIENK
jgi:hypothetical protein